VTAKTVDIVLRRQRANELRLSGCRDSGTGKSSVGSQAGLKNLGFEALHLAGSTPHKMSIDLVLMY
jgi:hypothetical protein